MSDWISVKDRLPEVGARVTVSVTSKSWTDRIVQRTEFAMSGFAFDGSLQWRIENKSPMYYDDTITHWMPLPEPPEQEKP